MASAVALGVSAGAQSPAADSQSSVAAEILEYLGELEARGASQDAVRVEITIVERSTLPREEVDRRLIEIARFPEHPDRSPLERARRAWLRTDPTFEVVD
jgi:hypothetical protein